MTPDDLLPLVYGELRKLAAAKLAGENPGYTLEATALVHEAWLKLADASVEWQDRSHFLRTAAYGRYHPTFAEFRAAVQDVLDRVPTTHAEKLASLMTHNFQEFDAVSLLAA
ncbi:MAG: ECF-type sigma factor [Gemmataceae bacterium]